MVAFASTSEYRPRECYAGIAEFSVYVAREQRGRGAGRAGDADADRGRAAAGFWKLVSRVFVENLASRSLLRDARVPRGRHLRAARAARRGLAGRGDRRAAGCSGSERQRRRRPDVGGCSAAAGSDR